MNTKEVEKLANEIAEQITSDLPEETKMDIAIKNMMKTAIQQSYHAGYIQSLQDNEHLQYTQLEVDKIKSLSFCEGYDKGIETVIK